MATGSIKIWGLLPFGFEETASVPIKEENSVNSQTDLKTDKTFWILCLIPAFAAFITGFCTHLSGFGTSIGLSTAIGALMVSASMIGNTSSKLGMGVLCDVFGARRAVQIMLGIASLGLLLVMFFSGDGNQILLMLAAICIGMSFSICGVGMSNMVKEVYGPKKFSKVYAALAVPIAIGGASSYSIIGFSYDIFHSYYPIACVCIAFGVLGILCVEIIYKQKKQAR